MHKIPFLEFSPKAADDPALGADRDWTNGIFNQANRYPWAGSPGTRRRMRAVAAEWAAQTFTPDPAFVKPMVDMMMISREAVVNYMTPLGLHHQMATGHANWLTLSCNTRPA